MLNFLDRKRSNKSHQDEIDLVFQGYSVIVKKLSGRRQIETKFKISKIIMEVEMAEQIEKEANSQQSTSYSSISSNAINIPIRSSSINMSSLSSNNMSYSSDEVSDEN